MILEDYVKEKIAYFSELVRTFPGVDERIGGDRSRHAHVLGMLHAYENALVMLQYLNNKQKEEA